MKKKECLAACAAVLFVLFFFTSVSMNSENPPKMNRVADVSMGSYGIHWQPRVNHAKITLTVDCAGGYVFHKTFEAGIPPYFSLSDLKDQVIDGPYTYELIAVQQAEERDDFFSSGFGNEAKRRSRRLAQTGYFTVRNGSIVMPSIRIHESGPVKPSDQVIYDDLIVDGCLCAGDECYNAYVFGDETLVLRENLLRIYFEDTSSSAPANDWRIVINDTDSGSGEYFAIQDASGATTPFTIRAGASTDSLYVDSSGEVGIGTSVPETNLHIKGDSSPALRLEENSVQKWDMAIDSESYFSVTDVTGSGKQPFRIQPGALSNSFVIKGDGKIGLGTWEPIYAIHAVQENANCAYVAERVSGAKMYMNATSEYANFGSASDHNLRLMTGGTAKVVIDMEGDMAVGGYPADSPPYKLTVYNDARTAYGYSDGGAWATGSSREFKENIKDIDAQEALAAFEKLNPVRFNYKGVQDDEHLGFIAEDVPEIVAVKNRDAISAMDIVTLLTKVVQEQQKNAQQQQKTINELKERIAELEKK